MWLHLIENDLVVVHASSGDVYVSPVLWRAIDVIGKEGLSRLMRVYTECIWKRDRDRRLSSGLDYDSIPQPWDPSFNIYDLGSGQRIAWIDESGWVNLSF